MESSFLNPSKALDAAHLHEGMRVADFGAGAGFFARAAARRIGHSGVVWAVDAHRELLPRLRNLAEAEGLKNIEVVCGNIEKKGGSNLPDAHFDLVIGANVLFSAHHRRGVVQEMLRVLKNGGSALVIDWRDSFGGMGPHGEHVITAAEAQELFTKSGFTYVRDIPAGEYHWGFMVRKNAA